MHGYYTRTSVVRSQNLALEEVDNSNTHKNHPLKPHPTTPRHARSHHRYVLKVLFIWALLAFNVWFCFLACVIFYIRARGQNNKRTTRSFLFAFLPFVTLLFSHSLLFFMCVPTRISSHKKIVRGCKRPNRNPPPT